MQKMILYNLFLTMSTASYINNAVMNNVKNETIIGDNNVINGHSNTVKGNGNVVNGNGNTVQGKNNTVNGINNLCIGRNNTSNEQTFEVDVPETITERDFVNTFFRYDNNIYYDNNDNITFTESVNFNRQQDQFKLPDLPRNGEDDAPNNTAEDLLCVICSTRKKCVTIHDCGHLACCLTCIHEWVKNQQTCPVCRGTIIKVTKTFI